jgi:hypothetical protein
MLKNAFDFSYAGPIYMGSNGEPVQVVYDTGSDWLCVETIACVGGKAQKFDNVNSTSFQVLKN